MSGTASKNSSEAGDEKTGTKRIKPGTIVEFELGLGPDGKPSIFPRWDGDKDNGPTGVWCRGHVVEIDGEQIIVDFDPPRAQGVERGAETWAWPMDGIGSQRDGWLRLVVCECGAEKVYGVGTPHHSRWCPRWDIDSAH